MSRKKISTVFHGSCPHCGQAEGCLKQAGAFRTHEDQVSAQLVKWFHAKCKACDQGYILREVWPLSPESGENNQEP